MSHLTVASPSAHVRQSPDWWFIIAQFPETLPDSGDRQQSLAGPFIGFTEAERYYPAVVSLYYVILGHSTPSPEYFTYYHGHHPHHDRRVPAQWMNPLIGLNDVGRPLLPDSPDVLETIHHHLQDQGPAALTPGWLTPWTASISPDRAAAAQALLEQTLRHFQTPEIFWDIVLAMEQGVWHPCIDHALALGIFIPPPILQYIFQTRIRLRLTTPDPSAPPFAGA